MEENTAPTEQVTLDELANAIDQAEVAINEHSVPLPNTGKKTDIAKLAEAPKPNPTPTPAKPVTKKEQKQVERAEKNEYELFRDYVNTAQLALKDRSGKLYLKAEAWLYLARLKGVVPACSCTERYEDGQLVSVKATCELLDMETKRMISCSDMMASKSEPFLKDLGDFALYGMAQTRAISRAIRNVFGYVAKGAGFEATPAVEMGLERVTE